jgi:hypothetical protein
MNVKNVMWFQSLWMGTVAFFVLMELYLVPRSRRAEKAAAARV